MNGQLYDKKNKMEFFILVYKSNFLCFNEAGNRTSTNKIVIKVTIINVKIKSNLMIMVRKISLIKLTIFIILNIQFCL